MIGTDPTSGRRSIASTLQLALLGLTVALAVIGAIGIAALYGARQTYEDELAATAALEVSAANLLASTVALQANLARPRSRRAARFVRSAARSFTRSANRVVRRAGDDAATRALAARLAPARGDARALAEHPTVASTRASAQRNLRTVRRLVPQIARRQRARRREAREAAASRSRTALVAIVLSAGLALVSVLAFLTLLIRAMRRPLDDLVAATRRMAAGDLGARVEPGGPNELEALGAAFNQMGADLTTASARVEAERERLQTTIQSLGDGLVLCDMSDRITSLNPRARELVPSLRVGAAAHGPDTPLPALADALGREVTVRRDGDLTLAVTAARLAGPDGGTVWTLRDITERARLERAKSDFVATASHELRSPLTSIKGFMELLETTSAENLTDRQREFIGIVLKSTDRLVELVNDLLDIARIESGQFELHARSVNLRETVEEVAALMAPRLESKRQRLDVQIFEPRPPAHADPARIRQVITNLVTNAHLYTGEGGTIALRLDGDAQATTITVADTGRGMTPEDTRRIFDRFYRGSSTEPKGPGTGLGLAIVKSLVDLHGGTIDVASELGRGTTFTVRLPAAPTVSGGGGPAQAAPSARSLDSRRVLIVDDEPSLATLIAQQLQPLGVQTVQVHSGADALARLRSERFDAMTLDVLMPGMSGFDVLDAVRADPKLRDLPVIFVSVSSRAPQLEGEWAVAKPIDRNRLADVLEAAIQAKRSRVLVLAPDALRAELEPLLAPLGIEHRWETTPDGAMRAGAEELFEVALVHESMGTLPAVVDGSALRGRRRGRSVILFTTNGDGAAPAGGIGMPVFGLAPAVGALRAALGESPTAGGAR
ncbi:MAG TPA: ATP-binding protein [Solirubrobacteraceae bacterium]|nr:ATP-binding protein [Solirubrobacteraceae bacterium]